MSQPTSPSNALSTPLNDGTNQPVRRVSFGGGQREMQYSHSAKRFTSTPPELGGGKCCGLFDKCCLKKPEAREVDALFIGGGIISMTIALMLKKLQPDWDVVVVERQGAVGEESSDAFSNAGTGHSGFCEPNYTPRIMKDGKETVMIGKPIYACEAFMAGRQFWSYLVKAGLVKYPEKFIRTCPHIAFGPGEEKKKTIQLRYEAMQKEPLFASMQYSDDPVVMRKWAPLVMEGRDPNEPCAMTFVPEGTDVDFGALTRACAGAFIKIGGDLRLFSEVTALHRYNIAKEWRVTTRKQDAGRGYRLYKAKFVFVGAGGWSLPMLQMAHIPEIQGYSALSVDGEWAVCQNPAVVDRHPVKVYAPGPVGAPPMSMPHIDARVIGGKKMLLFGPWCQWTPRFLKKGKVTDAFRVLKLHNLLPLATSALKNLDLAVFLVSQMTTSYPARFQEIKEYYPLADPDDWTFVPAAVRAQIVKRAPGSKTCGALQFGTEVIHNKFGDLCGLMGASPGASTCVQIAVDVLRSCFPKRFPSWEPAVKQMIPTFGTKLNEFRALVPQVYQDTAKVLGLEKYDIGAVQHQLKGQEAEMALLKKQLAELEGRYEKVSQRKETTEAELATAQAEQAKPGMFS